MEDLKSTLDDMNWLFSQLEYRSIFYSHKFKPQLGKNATIFNPTHEWKKVPAVQISSGSAFMNTAFA